MERLTDELKIGAFAGLKDKAASAVGGFGSYEAFYAYSLAVNKLFDYEDTGLEPSEIAALKEANLDAESAIYLMHEMELGADIYLKEAAEKDQEIAALKAENERLKVAGYVDCATAERGADGKCLGYAAVADEPCEVCKNCDLCEFGYKQLELEESYDK